jgi:hypothetical protein
MKREVWYVVQSRTSEAAYRAVSDLMRRIDHAFETPVPKNAKLVSVECRSKRLHRRWWELLLLLPSKWEIRIIYEYKLKQGTDDEPESKHATNIHETDTTGTAGEIA